MMGWLIFAACLWIAGRRFYKQRALFKTLTKAEWLQYVGSFASALAIAMIVILGTAKLLTFYDFGALRPVIGLIVIFAALAFVNVVMRKLLPEKLKSFYS